jgi:glycerol-3-phosphate dehydrogenase
MKRIAQNTTSATGAIPAPTAAQIGPRTPGVVYYDGQFDDSRLLINLVETAFDQGATLVNYAPVVAITKGADGFIDGVVAVDQEGGREWTLKARVVVNATGAFSDSVRRLAEPDAVTLMAPSQGIHLVFDHSFLSSDAAIMVPHTSDGRVMFAIPWHGHALVGTTDTPVATPTLEPQPLQEEIEFVLETAGQYLHKPPTRADVLSVFVGIRPLVKSGDGKLTAALSRDHTIHIDDSGLMTTTGGKWTTYRNMAEHTVDQAADLGCRSADVWLGADGRDGLTVVRGLARAAAPLREVFLSILHNLT